jgi:hypothetical protein
MHRSLPEAPGQPLGDRSDSKGGLVSRAQGRELGRWHGAWVWALGLLLLGMAGCGRAFYRRQADDEVYALVHCAADNSRWPLEGYTIQPDPRSRMFDPFSPDYPPMPPDDPTAHRLMHCVDCKRGWPCWHCSGDTPYVDNPDWMAYLPCDEQGQVVLDRQQAMEMALLQSREYQFALEDVYLSALDVTLQRFRFDVQFFGGNETFFRVDGPLSGSASSSRILSTGTDAKARRLFATGGELIVDVANSVVWDFAGAGGYDVDIPLAFELTQPLLRAAGRAVVLESLTTSERLLLADIRAMERFRRSFYVQTVVDYLALLEDQVRIRNQEANVSQLQYSLKRLATAFELGGPNIRRGDVERTRQSVYAAQSNLLSINTDYEDLVDAYKIVLGLPPELDVLIEDPLLKRFDLISPGLAATRKSVVEFLVELKGLERQGPLDQNDYRDKLTSILQEATVQLDVVQQDLQVLERAAPERRRSLPPLAERKEFQRDKIDPRIASVEVFDRRVAAVQRDFAATAETLRAIFLELESFETDSPEDAAPPGDAAESSDERLIDLVDEMSNGLLELSLIQARVRLDSITLVPIDLIPEKALEIARRYRRDWMNARSALVDTWRQIEVVANTLESDLDLTFSGGLTPTSNTLDAIHNTTGNLRLGLEFDAPLTRLVERNAYRVALIDYQRARRDYYGFEDLISRSLRGRLRTMSFNELDLEIQRAAVFTAIVRVNETRLRLEQEPPKQPGGGGGFSDSFVERLLSDFTALLSAQNRFLSVWVDQEVERMNLDLDLGTMQLDDRGLWIDPGSAEGSGEDQGEWIEDAPLPPGDAEEIPVPPVEPVEPDGV